MSIEELSEVEIVEILDPEADLLEIAAEIEGADEDDGGVEGESPEQVEGLTGNVRLYDVSCTKGAGTAIAVPINAFYWNARLGYYRSDGGRIGLSPIAAYRASAYPGVTIRARFNGRLPAGLRDLRAFWWYGAPGDTPGPVYWNHVGCRC
jgi:hypothetical protein